MTTRRGARPPIILLSALIMVLALASAGTASAAPAPFHSSSEPVFIAEVVLLLVSGRLLGELAQRLGQPPVTGQLLAGIVLGPSVFGALFPHLRSLVFPPGPEQRSMLEGISQLGILMLLLLTGLETDLALVRKVRMPALLVALSGVAIPFACGFALGELLPASLLPDPGRRLLAALFLGTALSISSIKIVAMVVRDMNFMRRNLGQVIVASAIIEDTTGWIIISLAMGVALNGGLDAFSLARTIGGIAIFLGASFTIGRPLVFRAIRWVNDTFESEFAVITAILVIMGAMALLTAALGMQTVLGAFVAGVLIGESPILTRHIDAQLRGLIVALFMPVFFGLAGLAADLRVFQDPKFLLLAALIIVLASAGKFAGAWLGARMGGLNTREAVALGCGMNARGSTEVIVASIGLAAGAFTQGIFTIVVTMAVVTTLLMPPLLRRALAGLPMGSEERARLEREEIDAEGFVPSLERLLLAVDASAAGKLAARLAGLIAGARGIPLTLVEVGLSRAQRDGAEPGSARDVVQSGVAEGARSSKEEAGTDPAAKADISHEPHADRRRFAEIAGKGFDLLFVGVGDSRTSDGRFTRKVASLVEATKTSIAILVAEGDVRLPAAGARILVPVTGTPASRRGAEVAFILARALQARVTALYVTRRKPADRGRVSMSRRDEEAILRDTMRLAARYGVDVRTAIESRPSPDAPILRHAAAHDLVVMGVSRRQGDTLLLGDTAAAVMAQDGGPLLFIADSE